MGIPHSWRTGSSRGQEHSSTSTPPPMELPMILTPYFPGLILIDQDPCWHIGIYVGEQLNPYSLPTQVPTTHKPPDDVSSTRFIPGPVLLTGLIALLEAIISRRGEGLVKPARDTDGKRNKNKQKRKEKGRSRWIPACFLLSAVTMCTPYLACRSRLTFPGIRFQASKFNATCIKGTMYPLFSPIIFTISASSFHSLDLQSIFSAPRDTSVIDPPFIIPPLDQLRSAATRVTTWARCRLPIAPLNSVYSPGGLCMVYSYTLGT